MEPQLSGKVRFKRLSIKQDQSVAKDISKRVCAINECKVKQNIGIESFTCEKKIPLLNYTERNKIFNYSWLFIFSTFYWFIIIISYLFFLQYI